MGHLARHWPVVFRDAFQRVPRQVQPVEFGIVPLQRGDDLDRLRVVIEATVGFHQLVQRIFAGVAKGRVAQIMGQRHRNMPAR